MGGMGNTMRSDGSARVGPRCPKCGSLEVEKRAASSGAGDYVCKHCGHTETRAEHDWYRDAPDEGGEG